MLLIRASQFRVLAQSRVRSFAPTLMHHARACHPQQANAMRELDLTYLVETTIEAAISYGLTSLPDVARLLDLTLVLGPPLPAAVQAMMEGSVPTDPARRLEKAWNDALFKLDVQT